MEKYNTIIRWGKEQMVYYEENENRIIKICETTM